MKSENRKVALLLLFAAIVLFIRLNSWGVTESSEARYAEISREMYLSGDYIHPTLLQIGHYHKPPITYWITAASYHIFGVSTFAARFFLQVAVLLQIWLVFKIGSVLLENKKTAFYSACIYFSFPAVIIGARALTTDLYLTTTVLAAIYSWMVYRKNHKVLFLYLFYIFLAMGFMIKGPVVFIIPLIFVIAYNKLVSPIKTRNGFHHLVGALVLLFLGLSWFAILIFQNTDFLNYFIFHHTIDRIVTNDFGRKKPFWFYLWIVPLTAFPWFLIILKPLFANWKKKFNVLHVLTLWIIVPLVFFSLSTSKLILYVLPIYAGIALAGGYIWQLGSTSYKRWMLALLLFIALVVTGLSIAPYWIPEMHFDPAMYTILILLCLLMAGMIFLMITGRSKSGLLVSSILFSSLLTLFSTYFFHQNPALVNDQKNVADYIKHLPKVKHVYVYNKRLPSLAFHLNQDIISIADGDKGLLRETQFEENDNWENFLIGPNQIVPKDIPGSVMVIECDDNVSESMKRILNQFNAQKDIDGWRVYSSQLQASSSRTH